MKIFRPILSLILVLATTLLVSCGGPSASAPPTYTPEKLQKISTYRIPLDVARQRIPELGQYITNEDWVNADNFLHGPLGLIRRDLTYLSNALLPDEQKPALDVAKDIFKHIENIDAAVDEKNYRVAINQYKEVVSDLDSYSSLIPETKKPVDQAAKAMEEAEVIFEGVKAEIEDTIEQISPEFDDNA
ncbi:photosystem II protein PsbQ [Pleurocapsa sp. PCC 7319]|uniref:photosystem II protein PsbQ n=1 Tax=Pleurocapsa sp. PCC 7319 TaxID=118161 RepID=UPI00034D56EC|nr:photosystem II protein PsbQ [Pleurocapsa sp. PCC 7319]